LDEAEENLKITTRLKPANASFCRNLAMAYQEQGKAAESGAAMEHVQRLSGKGKPYLEAMKCIKQRDDLRKQIAFLKVCLAAAEHWGGGLGLALRCDGVQALPDRISALYPLLWVLPKCFDTQTICGLCWPAPPSLFGSPCSYAREG
jgi:hypothetical protein